MLQLQPSSNAAGMAMASSSEAGTAGAGSSAAGMALATPPGSSRIRLGSPGSIPSVVVDIDAITGAAGASNRGRGQHCADC
jgi:hypothetical protein